MIVINVVVDIRKGLGPEYVEKVFSQAYDDVPQEITWDELKKWAIEDTERYLFSTDDYPIYGKNWIIKGCYDE